jgi:glycosyltransferase involved in cell wall biosynthesis
MAEKESTKKILIIAAVPQTLRCFLLPFAYHLRSQGWQVDAMSHGISSCPQCKEAFDQTWNVDLARSPLNCQNLFSAPQQIQNVVTQENYEIVHVHMAVAAFVTRYALKGLRKQGKPKVIYTSHGFNFYKGGGLVQNTVFLLLEKLASCWTDYLVVMNQEDTQAAKTHKLISLSKLHYMPGIGVDIEKYNEDRISDDQIKQVRKELGIQPDTSLFLSIAEFIPRKRHQDILQAFAKIRHSNACLLLAGDGPLKKRMQKLAAELGLSEKVYFLGFRQDIPTLIKASAATVLVSEQEGLPRSVLESMCLGVPTIGTAIRGTQDLLQDGCGYLIPVGDINTLTQAFSWFLDHPDAGKVMGKKCQDCIQKYDLRKIIQLHEDLYSTALQAF